MLQNFENKSSARFGAERLARLRSEMARDALDGFIIPRADAHQGEYVAPHDERLQWLTGFTGSAGFCCALQTCAGVFIDGRYRTQVKSQVDLKAYTPVPWPDVTLPEWLKEQFGGDDNTEAVIGFDPWLITQGQLESYRAALAKSRITLRGCANLVDAIWDDQPPPPTGKAMAYSVEFAGVSSADKRSECARDLQTSGEDAAIITLPDSICWLLNIRGADVSRTPLVHGFAILQSTGQVTFFVHPDKTEGLDLGEGITCAKPEDFSAALRALSGTVRCDKTSVPVAVIEALADSSADVVYGDEPCALPKARKNRTEIAGARAAHLTDAAAMCELLCWLDAQPAGSITEIDVVQRLEQFRRASNKLQDISFDTIAGSGPNGAIMHYRVTKDTARTLERGDLLVLDSGGQYLNGTTDITRTIPIGSPGKEERTAFTQVLQGMISVSMLRWPKGLAGRDIEAIGRVPLWQAGRDFDHGLGHGVGHFLSVHEGPQRLSKISHVPLEPGMILSNEPGYYREGAFGIRIENLIVVREADPIEGGDAQRHMYDFETLTYVPIDRRLIRPELLSASERAYLNTYHGRCRAKLTGHLSEDAQNWLEAVTAAL